MGWLNQQRDKLESEWLKQHYFQPFTAPDGAAAIKQDHVRIALESRSELAPLAEQLKQQGSTETEARQKTVAHMLDFVQAIPYQLLDSQSGRQGKGFLSPRQVLEQNQGDCDSKVTLMAAMLAQLFPELKQAMVFVPGHALLGVALPAKPGEATLNRTGRGNLSADGTHRPGATGDGPAGTNQQDPHRQPAAERAAGSRGQVAPPVGVVVKTREIRQNEIDQRGAGRYMTKGVTGRSGEGLELDGQQQSILFFQHPDDAGLRLKGGQQVIVGGQAHPDGLAHIELMLGDGDPHAVGAEIPADPFQYLLLLKDGDGGIDYHALEGASFLGAGDHANILCCLTPSRWPAGTIVLASPQER